jgi:uncharacterized protein (TIGR02996 family)
MTSHSFLRAIFENPNDDFLRLVYADWLEERGDPRGEFIRVQCELTTRLRADIAQMEKDYEQRKTLRGRAEQLFNAYGQEWNRPMRDSGCHKWEYRRGFVEAVELSGDAFLKSAAMLFRTEPIQCLCLTGSIPDVVGFTRIEQLTRPTELVLHGAGIGNAGAQTLVASPHLWNITSLDLSHNNIGDAGAQALASSPNLAALTLLSLASDPYYYYPGNRSLGDDIIQDLGARVLASSPFLVRLKGLDLSDNEIGTPGREALRSRFGHVSEGLVCGVWPDKWRAIADCMEWVESGIRTERW